ncbi:pC105R [African swine fever virus]|nr:pC105R [African swine fever virus]
MLMKICKACSSCMVRTYVDGNIIFRCSCGESVQGDSQNLLVSSKVYHTGEMEDKYKIFIKNAPFDPTNCQIKKDCPNCHLDYLTQICIGSQKIIILVCRCGYTSNRG